MRFEDLKELFDDRSEAVIALDGKTPVYCNSAALALMPDIRESGFEAIPGHELWGDSGRFSYAVGHFGRTIECDVKQVGNFTVAVLEASYAESGQTEAIEAVTSKLNDKLSLISIAAGSIASKTDEFDSDISVIIRNIHSILGMTNNITDTVTMTPEKALYNSSLFDICGLYEKIVKTSDDILSKKNIRLKYFCEENEMIVSGDKLHLESLLLQLISNAAKYGAGNVSAEIKRSGNTVHLTVSDDGKGFGDRISSAWKSYAAPKNLTDTKAGAGFGLSAVKKIASAHGGSVLLECGENKGARITVALPIIKRPEEIGGSFSNIVSIYGDSRDQWPGNAEKRLLMNSLADVLDSSDFSKRYRD